MCFKITWRILIIASKVKSTEKMNIGGGGINDGLRDYIKQIFFIYC